MAFKDIFKKRETKKEEKKIDKVSGERMEELNDKTIIHKKEKRVVFGENYRILKSPHVSEKATELVGKNQYVFNVYERTNKLEIKRAIEEVYGTDVLSVKIIKVPQKKRRLGKISGFRKGYKKAIVKIKEGQKIEIMPR